MQQPCMTTWQMPMTDHRVVEKQQNACLGALLETQLQGAGQD